MGHYMGCKQFTGLIAAALYEPLDEKDSQALAAHLEQCSHCRKEAAELKAFLKVIPNDPIVFEGDLLPVIREKLREEAAPGAWSPWRWLRPAYMLAVAALPLVLLGYSILPMWDNVQPNAPARQEAEHSAVAAVLAEADTMIERRAYGPALTMLEEKLDEFAGQPGAGELQRAIADIEFNHLRRYPEAYAAYMTLQGDYWDTFRQNPEHSERLNLLAEVKEQDFEPLYTLDAVGDRHSQEAIPQLERLIAQHEGKALAWRAVDVMQEVTLRELGIDPASAEPEMRIATLEMLCEQSGEEVVSAHLNLALGDTYRHEYNNNGKARDHYQQVVQSGIEQLAQRAELSLTELADAS